MEYFLLHLEIVIQMDTALHIFIQWLGFFNNLFCIVVRIIKILLLLLLFSISEFAVSTQVLQDEENAARSNHGTDFQVNHLVLLLVNVE